MIAYGPGPAGDRNGFRPLAARAAGAEAPGAGIGRIEAETAPGLTPTTGSIDPLVTSEAESMITGVVTGVVVIMALIAIIVLLRSFR
ncbi:MAG: hypothetical protein J2P23_12505 [Microlunatus sp.]|nr:hypothetical protein [Microlunatus sp.]